MSKWGRDGFEKGRHVGCEMATRKEGDGRDLDSPLLGSRVRFVFCECWRREGVSSANMGIWR